MPSDDQAKQFFDSTGAALDRLPDAVRPATDGAIFNDKGEILLQLRADNGFWGLPGGNVDPGESIEACAVREVYEETGLHVSVKRLVGIYSDPGVYSIMRYPSGALIQYVTIVFECERHSGKLRISEESTDIGYFPVHALPENTMLSHRIRIEDAASQTTEPIIK